MSWKFLGRNVFLMLAIMHGKIGIHFPDGLGELFHRVFRDVGTLQGFGGEDDLPFLYWQEGEYTNSSLV
jgi:hypothetical protein